MIRGFSQRRALKRKFFNQHSVIKLELNKLLLHTRIFFNIQSDLII